MDPEERLDRYCELVVRVGVNLQPGQHLLISGLVEHAPMVRALAATAYRAGARYVDVTYSDQRVRRAMLEHATDDEILTWTPPFLLERIRYLAEHQGALISIAGDPEPDLFADLDPRRVGRARMLELSELQLGQINSRSIAWTIVAFPNEGWAQTVFGAADVESLWDAVGRAVRLYEQDPVAAWQAHVDRLVARSEALNRRRLDAVRFSGPGTDLTVGLNPTGRWLAARLETTFGVSHVPNLPTEEVFTTPDFRRVEGTVRATKPLHLPNEGVTVRDLEMRFEAGRAVEVDASTGAEVVRTQMATDAGAVMLGEVALVDGSSAVGRTGLVFSNTLFDENATSHIAYGGGLAFAVDGVTGRSPEEQRELGVNYSKIHTDFMIGGPEVNVDGITESGDTLALIRDDVWQLEGR
jgi:aminopeptidase